MHFLDGWRSSPTLLTSPLCAPLN